MGITFQTVLSVRPYQPATIGFAVSITSAEANNTPLLACFLQRRLRLQAGAELAALPRRGDRGELVLRRFRFPLATITAHASFSSLRMRAPVYVPVLSECPLRLTGIRRLRVSYPGRLVLSTVPCPHGSTLWCPPPCPPHQRPRVKPCPRRPPSPQAVAQGTRERS